MHPITKKLTTMRKTPTGEIPRFSSQYRLGLGSGPNLSQRQEKPNKSWDAILQQQEKIKYENSLLSNTSTTSFRYFDPFRTVEFLILELQDILHNLLPGNKIVRKMLNEIRISIKRIIEARFNRSDENTPKIIEQSAESMDHHNELTTPLTNEQKLLTNTNDTLKTQNELGNILEIDQKKHQELQIKYSDLELACTELRNEKFITETELTQSKAEVADLMEKITYLEKNQLENSCCDKTTIEQLEEKCRSLETEIKTLQENASSTAESEALADELNLKLQKTFNEKIILGRSLHENAKQLALLKMEKEKLLILLKAREMHLNDMEEELIHVRTLAKECVAAIGKHPKEYNPPIAKELDAIQSSEGHYMDSSLPTSQSSNF